MWFPPEVMSDSSVNKFSENKYLVTGGNEYDYADKGTSKNDLNSYYGDQLDNTYDIYMDAYGYVLGTVKVDGDLKYLFLTGYDKSASHLSGPGPPPAPPFSWTAASRRSRSMSMTPMMRLTSIRPPRRMLTARVPMAISSMPIWTRVITSTTSGSPIALTPRMAAPSIL